VRHLQSSARSSLARLSGRDWITAYAREKDPDRRREHAAGGSVALPDRVCSGRKRTRTFSFTRGRTSGGSGEDAGRLEQGRAYPDRIVEQTLRRGRSLVKRSRSLAFRETQRLIRSAMRSSDRREMRAAQDGRRPAVQ